MSWSARRIGRKASCTLFTSLGFLLALVSFVATYVPHHNFVRALQTGQYEVIEGPIRNFQLGSATRPVLDQRFDVGGKHFVVDFTSDRGFPGFKIDDFPRGEKGVLARDMNGVQVRVTFLDRDPPQILRIEKKRSVE